MDETSEVIRQRREKARALAEKNVELYPNDFRVSHTVAEARALIEEGKGNPADDDRFAMAGRIMGIRSFGRAAFIQLSAAT